MSDTCEIVIACRGELPENLERTVARVIETKGERDVCTVVMDGEQIPRYKLPACVRVVQPWMESRGCGQARHYAMSRSEADWCALIDGHMLLPDGWLDAVRPGPLEVTCACMQSLTHAWDPIEGQLYAGAFLALRCREADGQHWGLAAKWNRGVEREDRLTGAPMGACYGITRKWYDAIGQPLSLLEAWGCDEELLGACTWLRGGVVRIADVTCGHVYAAPYRRNAAKGEASAIWANRIATLRALGAPEDLEQWTRKSLAQWNRVDALLSRKQSDIERVRAACCHRSWDNLIANGFARELTTLEVERGKVQRVLDIEANKRRSGAEGAIVPMSTSASPTPSARPKSVVPTVTRKADVCPECGFKDTIRLSRGLRDFGVFRQAPARCSHCGTLVRLRVV